MDGLTVDLHTTNGAAGMVDSANVFASQAKAAGVTVNVHNDPNYYGDQYLKLPFSVDFWGTRNYLPQVANSMLPAGPPTSAVQRDALAAHFRPGLELHQPVQAGPRRGRPEQAVRHHPRDADASNTTTAGTSSRSSTTWSTRYSTKVSGFEPGKATLNLDSFGHGYRTIWFNA